jgi:hypothetical protein
LVKVVKGGVEGKGSGSEERGGAGGRREEKSGSWGGMKN